MEVVVFDREWIEEQFETLPLWQQSAYTDFAATIADEANTFPCIPARMGFYQTICAIVLSGIHARSNRLGC